MSDFCHRCGPVKHEAPTVLCAPCLLELEKESDRVLYFVESVIEKDPPLFVTRTETIGS